MSVNDILRVTAVESDPAEEQRELRWRRGRQRPEDGGYLLLLAAAPQRGGSAPQTMGGFEVAHRNRGNGFSVPNTGASVSSSVLVPEGNTLLGTGEGEAFNHTV